MTNPDAFASVAIQRSYFAAIQTRRSSRKKKKKGRGVTCPKTLDVPLLVTVN
jgi:hypothetical protein